MNELGIALLWCILQVTLLSLLAAGFYAMARHYGPRAGALVTLTSMALVVALTLLAFSPWPRWTLAFAGNAEAVASMASPEAEPQPSFANSDPEQVSPAGEASVETGAAPNLANQSPLADFWRALRDEASRASTPAATEDRPIWPTVLAGMALLGATLGVTRLIAGMIAVTRYQRQSMPVEHPQASEILDVLLAELGCRRRPEMRESDAFFSAAAVGWRQPMILLPTPWRKWSDGQLRAVLAHEITHIQSNDFLACLLAQIALALHFYHPLVHWLVARLRLEQELAADAVAAELSGGRRFYLTTLAAMALDQEQRNVVWPARAFLPAKTAFLRRIVVLRNSHRPVRNASGTSRAVAVACMIVAGVFVAGLRQPAGNQALAQQPTPAEEGDPSASSGAIDLSYVPADAMAVLAIRPAAILKRANQLGLKDFIETLARNGSTFEPVEGIVAEDLEQLTFYVLSDAANHTQDVTLLRTVPTVRLAEVVPARAELTRSAGKTYFRTRHRSFFQYDDRTIAVCSPPDKSSLPQFLTGRPGSGPSFLADGIWEQDVDECVLAAVDCVAAATQLSQAVHGPPQAPLILEFFRTPPHDEVKAAMLTMRLGDSLDVRAALSCRSEAGTAKVQKTLEAYSVIGQNLLARQITQVASMGNVQEVCDEFFDSIETAQEGSQVQATGAIRIEEDWPVRFAEQIAAARDSARRMQSSNNLKLLALAMHNYHDTYKTFPSAVLYGPDGKTPYSWRVAVLPFVGQGTLYDRYRFDEPWDGPNNRKLLEEMPAVFCHPGAPGSSQHSSYFGLVGPGAIFDGDEATSLRDVMDGSSNTLMLVEAKRDIPWTSPNTVEIDISHSLLLL